MDGGYPAQESSNESKEERDDVFGCLLDIFKKKMDWMGPTNKFSKFYYSEISQSQQIEIVLQKVLKN